MQVLSINRGLKWRVIIKISFVGLGKMGFSMVELLMRDGHLFDETIEIDVVDLFLPDILK